MGQAAAAAMLPYCKSPENPSEMTRKEIYLPVKKEKQFRENQDGGVGRHTAPPPTTRTDRKSNVKEVRHKVNKK